MKEILQLVDDLADVGIDAVTCVFPGDQEYADSSGERNAILAARDTLIEAIRAHFKENT